MGRDSESFRELMQIFNPKVTIQKVSLDNVVFGKYELREMGLLNVVDLDDQKFYVITIKNSFN